MHAEFCTERKGMQGSVKTPQIRKSLLLFILKYFFQKKVFGKNFAKMIIDSRAILTIFIYSFYTLYFKHNARSCFFAEQLCPSLVFRIEVYTQLNFYSFYTRISTLIQRSKNINLFKETK